MIALACVALAAGAFGYMLGGRGVFVQRRIAQAAQDAEASGYARGYRQGCADSLAMFRRVSVEPPPRPMADSTRGRVRWGVSNPNPL